MDTDKEASRKAAQQRYDEATPGSGEQMRAASALANLDPCAQIAESVGYSDGVDATATGRVGDGTLDALIDYKNALEDAVRRLTSDGEEAV